MPLPRIAIGRNEYDEPGAIIIPDPRAKTITVAFDHGEPRTISLTPQKRWWEFWR